jgi:putative ABC transport system substrate-binding protein
VKRFWILDFGFSIQRSESNKVFGLALCALLFALSMPAVGAQQPRKVPRVGFVGASDKPRLESFRQRLRDLGYIEDQNIQIEYRYPQGKNELYPNFVTELMQLNVDVLVITGLPGILAAKQATNTIPVVMLINADPVAAGVVHSLARPGGNITGLARLTRELSGKRLELLKETVPAISRVGVLWDDKGLALDIVFNEYEAAARALKIQVQSLPVRGPKPDLHGAFQLAVKERAGGVISITDALLTPYAKQIADLAINNRFPSMHEQTRYVEAGGLMSYSANDIDLYRRAATYVDKILKGAKPADLPIEQPTKFELVINLKTAKQIRLTIPPSVLARADKVIR